MRRWLRLRRSERRPWASGYNTFGVMAERMLTNKHLPAIDVSVLTVPTPRFAGQAKAAPLAVVA